MSSIRLNKEISVGHLLTAATMVFSVFAAYFTIDNRVTIVENNQKHLNITIARLETNYNRSLTNFNNKLTRIEDKLDRVIMGDE